LAEEVVTVALLDQATAWIEMESEKGSMEIAAAQPAMDALRGIFELFEDDDVLDLFEMGEPSDAALAGHSWINQQAGVVDQRIEAWFRPFGPVAGTGYLEDAAERASERAGRGAAERRPRHFWTLADPESRTTEVRPPPRSPDALASECPRRDSNPRRAA
jgi:hypothetical protein